MKLIENKKNAKIAFFATLIAGLIIHMYAITNHFLTFDSMWNLYSNQDMLSSGRPFLQYACMFSSYYDLPWLNGILAFIYLGFASIILTDLFHIKNKITIVIISICIVGFPSVASLFCYTYTVDGYALAVLLAISAVWATTKVKFGFIFGTFALGISMGIYQTYLSIAILLCIFVLLFELLETEQGKNIWRTFLKMLTMGILSYGIYLGSLKGMLLLKNTSLSGYQGTNKVLEFDFSNILHGIKSAYIDFVNFARYGGLLTPNLISKILILGLAFFGMIEMFKLIRAIWKKYGISRVLFVFMGMAILPLAVSTIAIISPETYFHTLLRYPWVMLLVFLIVLAEKNYRKEKSNVIHKTYQATAVLILVLMFNYFIAANIVYYNMNERYEKTYATSMRIVTRLEELDGYNEHTKVAILGGGLSPKYFELEESTYQITKNYFGSSGILCVSDTEKFATFFSHYLGVTVDTITMEKELEIVDMIEFQEMGIFPEKESIKWIGDVVVVKLNG